MKWTTEEIRKAVLEKKVQAITLDTSTFHRQGLALEYGLLRQLQQFSKSDLAVLLSDVVHGELKEDLTREAADAHAALAKAMRSMHMAAQIPQKTCDEVTAAFVGKREPASIAEKRLKDFVGATEVQIVESAAHLPVKELITRYFEIRPPFAKKDKRHEFPDAVALLSLENWAAGKKTFVLVVSADDDWKAFCGESDHLVLVDDLGTALGLFQDEAAQFFCRDFAKSLAHGDPYGIEDAIKSAIEDGGDEISVRLDADSQFAVSEQGEDHSIEITTIADPDDDESIEPVHFDGSILVVRFRVYATAQITGYFSFSSWDSIDREYIKVGSGSATTTEELTIEVLVTFSGNLAQRPAIVDVEVLQQELHVTFNDLVPDWMRDPSNYEEDD